MYKISVLAVGKLKENHWREAQDEFLKRLAPFAKLEVVEVGAEPITDTAGSAASMRSEGDRVLARLPADACVIALDRLGKKMPSEAFAGLIRDDGGAGRRLVFIIGGAAGLDRRVLDAAHRKISLSDMTFTHEMARVFLLEQVYRAMTILAGKKYHY